MKTEQVICLLAVLATACGPSPAPVAQRSPVTSASPYAISTTPTPSASAVTSPKSSPRPTATTLKCHLPITASASAGDPPGGWITFPGGTFVRDKGSLRFHSPAHLPSYDRAIGAWVPVEYGNVSPSGLSYVLYRDWTTAVPNALYVVDARTGKRRLMSSAQTPDIPWQVVLDYASEGIYLAAPGYGMAPPVKGLWLLDPNTGSIRLIDRSHAWSAMAGGAAWVFETPSIGVGRHQVYRLDLRTKNVSAWYETKTELRLISPTPQGGLLFSYGDVSSSKVGVLTGPNAFSPLKVPPGFKPYHGISARPGVWIALTDGIALYVKGQGVRVMAHNSGTFPIGAWFMDPAGGCW